MPACVMGPSDNRPLKLITEDVPLIKGVIG
jgi:hypothetical protein